MIRKKLIDSVRLRFFVLTAPFSTLLEHCQWASTRVSMFVSLAQALKRALFVNTGQPGIARHIGD
jgi:hypothetical protein